MTAPKSYIQIEGQTLDPANLTLPASRENRDAWTLNGDVVDVDPAKVAQLKEQEAQKIEEQVMTQVGTLKAIADVLEELVFHMSNGTMPTGLTREQSRVIVRNRLREAVRADLGIGT